MMDENQVTTADDQTIAAGHEPSGISIRGITWAFVGLTVLVVFSLIFLNWLTNLPIQQATSENLRTSPLLDEQAPPNPRLNAAQKAQLTQVRKDQQTRLNEYAPVSEADGVVRIPVNAAIDVLSEKGFAAFHELVGTPPAETKNIDAPKPGTVGETPSR